jgi:hypothetical protein
MLRMGAPWINPWIPRSLISQLGFQALFARVVAEDHETLDLAEKVGPDRVCGGTFRADPSKQMGLLLSGGLDKGLLKKFATTLVNPG